MAGGALVVITASPPPEAPWIVWAGGPRLASPILHPGLSHGGAPSGRLALDTEPADDEWPALETGLLSCDDAKGSGEQPDSSYSKRLAISAVSGIAARIPDSTIQGGRLSKPTGRDDMDEWPALETGCVGMALAITTASPPLEAPWLILSGVPRLASPMLHLGLSHSDAPSGRFDMEGRMK